MKSFSAIVIVSIMVANYAFAAPVATNSSTSAEEKTNTVYTPGKCSFKINNLMGGAFSVDNTSHIKGGVYTPAGTEEWSFPIRCYAGISAAEVDEQLDSRKVNGQWISNLTNEPFISKDHFETYSLNGVNWIGRISAYDDPNSDTNAVSEDANESHLRTFLFCLVETNGPQVLCGQPQGLTAGTINTDQSIKKILSVLRTIEFVEPPAKEPARAQSAALPSY